ncbi:hypothetical protein [Nonomuraea cavernae]|uniref:Uncharacterized protein n=1 Tax=Nonomuraea cavernae TaxID=2045107 RepID=A0A917Z9X2_9ACTN|nr:hypothetical protein [Nonomuraea cavernae]MCA2186404.1 hypothetical protein [Nonomuraea cavernae]GGO79226.1 hypothetical protein GCM10012289_63020 [Nonomuraea cavernae]
MNWAAVVPVLVGTVLGGLISLGTTFMTMRHQVRLERQKRAEERERAALAQAREGFARLQRMGAMPSQPVALHHYRRPGDQGLFNKIIQLQDQDNAWEKQLRELLLDLQIVIQDFSDDSLRARLEDMHTIVGNADHYWQYIGRSGSWTRSAACRHALECLGRFSRGAPLPEKSEFLVDALDTVEGQEELLRWSYADMARERKQPPSNPDGEDPS